MTGDELTPVGDAPAGATATATGARHKPTTRVDSYMVVRRLLTRFLITAPSAAAAHKGNRHLRRCPSCGAEVVQETFNHSSSEGHLHITGRSFKVRTVVRVMKISNRAETHATSGLPIMNIHTEVLPPVLESTTPQAAPRSRGKATRILTLAGLSAGMLLAACSSSSTPATTTSTTAPGSATTSPAVGGAAYLAADLKAPAAALTGSGSTFVQPFFTKAFYTYTSKNQGVQVNYQAVGSGAGITAFQQGTVDFAASDVPMSASDLAKVPASSGPVIQVPDILGGVSISYDLPGVTKRLQLDGPTLAGIFSGTIKTWDASQIAALNPGVTLPSNPIVPEVRADSSGTTYIFSDYLTSAAPTVWTLGASKTIAWPSSAVATPKNAGVAASIKSTPYSIGYVELNYAIQNNFTYAAVKNAAGVYEVPTAASVLADAAQKANITPTSFSIVNGPGAASYPIAGYSWVILLQKQTNQTTGAATVQALDWTTQTGGGQDLAASLDYVALPSAIQTYARTQLLTVTGPNGSPLLTK